MYHVKTSDWRIWGDQEILLINAKYSHAGFCCTFISYLANGYFREATWTWRVDMKGGSDAMMDRSLSPIFHERKNSYFDTILPNACFYMSFDGFDGSSLGRKQLRWFSLIHAQIQNKADRHKLRAPRNQQRTDRRTDGLNDKAASTVTCTRLTGGSKLLVMRFPMHI